MYVIHKNISHYMNVIVNEYNKIVALSLFAIFLSLCLSAKIIIEDVVYNGNVHVVCKRSNYFPAKRRKM